MFGNTLKDILQIQRNQYLDNRVPWSLTSLPEAILLQNGLEREGIFQELISICIHLYDILADTRH